MALTDAARYFALRAITLGATSYDAGDIVDTSSMDDETLMGLVRNGWLGQTTAGDVGRITVADTAPSDPQEHDLWLDTSEPE